MIPAIILTSLAVPSFLVVYAIDAGGNQPELTVKVTGNQWFWSYEYDDFDISFDSHIITEELLDGRPRLLTVDNSLLLPEGVRIRFLITSSDVIHS